MARLSCPCGVAIRLQQSPDPNAAVLVTERDDDEVERRNVVECPACLSLLVETRPCSNEYVRFSPDSDHPRGIDLGRGRGFFSRG
jgi:hypothetical protein